MHNILIWKHGIGLWRVMSLCGVLVVTAIVLTIGLTGEFYRTKLILERGALADTTSALAESNEQITHLKLISDPSTEFRTAKVGDSEEEISTLKALEKFSEFFGRYFDIFENAVESPLGDSTARVN